MKSILKTIAILLGVAVVGFGLIQLIPVNRTNPAVVTQVKWDSPQTQALFERACADCHSNQTTYPWYSYVAPVSWLVAHDISEGRQKFNLSDLSAMGSFRAGRLSEELGENVQSGRMPMPIYTLMHPTARLSDAEKQALISGLEKTISQTLAAQ